MRMMYVRVFLALVWCLLLGAGSISDTAGQGMPASAPASPESNPLPAFTIEAIGDFENRWFDVTVEAGEQISLTVGIKNTGDMSVTLSTFATNAHNPPNGGFAAGTNAEQPSGATLWIAYPSQEIELTPGEEQQIDLKVSVPEGTPPGEYVAALVVQTDKPLPVPGTDVFDQLIRSAISIEVTVPGEATSGFDLAEPSVVPTNDGAWALEVPIANTGTARIKPHGELVVMTPDGTEVSSTDIEMGSVYGGNTTTVSVGLPGQLPLGDYLVSINLTDETTGASDSIENAPITLEEQQTAAEEKAPFTIEAASVSPNDAPVQYADVVATITNNGADIPTANVTLRVMRDGEEVESYPLAEGKALPQGTTDFSQRYIPVDGWKKGTYTFKLVISAVSGDTETVIATVEIPDEIKVP